MIVLGIDPGFASLGLSAVDVTPGAERCLGVKVVRTEKSAKKGSVRASDDNARRAAEIAHVLSAEIDHLRPVAIAAEAQSWPRNAGASAKVGMAWGVLAAVAELRGIPIVQASPQEVKKALCGRKDASKEDVQRAVEQRLPGIEWPRQATLVEHAADATAVVLACLDSPALQMARRLAGAA